MIVYTSGVIDTPTLLKAINKKLVENIRLQKLIDYYDAKQEILLRFYDDTTKPNNRIVVNLCKQVSDFMSAYLVGIPIIYKGASEALTKTLKYNDDSQSVLSAVTNMNTCGFACELFYMDEDGNPRYSPLSPLECIIFMNDDLQRDISAFARLVKLEDEKGYNVTLYTADTVQTFALDEGAQSLTPVTDKLPHYWRDVPVNLYENSENLQGSFEQAIPMQDALNKIYSDNVNDFEQFVDAYLAMEGMQGTTPEDITEMKKQRVLLLPPDSKVYWLTKTVDKSHIKTLQDDLRAGFLEVCNCPDLKEMTGDFGDTSGVGIRMRLIKTEIAAAKQESSVKKAALRKVELLYNILSLSSTGQEYTEIEPLFTRNFLMTAEEQYEADGADRFGTVSDIETE